jgi:hypothetical protein
MCSSASRRWLMALTSPTRAVRCCFAPFRSSRSVFTVINESSPVITHIATTAPQPAAQGAVGNADAIRGAPDAAVARESPREELGQRRGRDDEPLGRRDLALRLGSTRGGTAHGA